MTPSLVSQSHPCSDVRARALHALVAFLLVSGVPRPPPVTAKEYFLSTEGRDDATGTAHAPWRSFERALWRLGAGDTLTMFAGVYREAAYGELSSSSTSAVTVVRARPGDDVVFDGRLSPSDALSTPWARVNATTWRATARRRWLDGLWIDGDFVPRVRVRSEIKPQTWFVDGAAQDGEVLLSLLPGVDPTHLRIEFRLASMITFSSPGWRIEGVTARYFNEYGIGVWKTSHVTIANCRALHNGGGGIETQESTHVVIERNETAYNGADGGPGWSSGIHLWRPTSSNNVVRYNLSHHNWDFSPHRTDGNGLAVDRGMERGGAELYGNVAYANGGRGIDITESANVRAWENTIYDNGRDPELAAFGEISVFAPLSTIGLDIRHNLIVTRGLNAPLLLWAGVDPTRVSSRENVMYNETAPNLVVGWIRDATRPLRSREELSLAEWRERGGADRASRSIPVRFSDPRMGDLRPCLSATVGVEFIGALTPTACP